MRADSGCGDYVVWKGLPGKWVFNDDRSSCLGVNDLREITGSNGRRRDGEGSRRSTLGRVSRLPVEEEERLIFTVIDLR